MASKLKFFFLILYLTFCMDVVYGGEINKIDDLLSDSISLEDKLEYLNSIKNNNNYSFVSSDIDTLIRIFSQDNGIQLCILKIFLQDKINEGILTQSQMSNIALMAISEFGMKDLEQEQNYKERRYLSLKLLIKINELKTNSDTYSDKQIRDLFRGLFDDVFQDDQYGKNKSKKINDIPQKWEHRDMVEDFIFDPIVLEMNDEYIEKDIEVLYNYEKYLLDHISFFPITDNLKKLVESAFLKTRFVELRSQYIAAMFYLDMREAILRIISDESIDTKLRIQAMSVSIDLLYQVDVLYFKEFSTSLLREMKKISSSLNKKYSSEIRINWDEQEELVRVAKEKIRVIRHIINQHDDMSDLEYVIFDQSISNNDKIMYLKTMLENGFCFPKEKLGFIKKVFDSDLDIEIKAEIAYIGLYGNTTEELLDNLNQYDIDSMGFLFSEIIEPKIHLQIGKTSKDKYRSKYTIKILTDKDEIIRPFREKNITDERLKQYYRFDMWKNLIENINKLKVEEEVILKLKVIRTSLELLSKTKDLKNFNKYFLRTLRKISNNEKEPTDVRNISDYILQVVEQERSLLDNDDIEEDIKQEKLRSIYESTINQVQFMIVQQEKKKQEALIIFVDIKELENNIYSSVLSVTEKLEYLDSVFRQSLYFSKEHLECINKVLNSGELDKSIIFTMAALVILRSTDSLVEEMSIEDVKYMKFLATYGGKLTSVSDRGRRIYIYNGKYEVDLDHSIYNKKCNMSDILMGIVDARSTIRFLYNRADIFRLSDYVEDSLEDEDIRKLAIKVGINILQLKVKRLDLESSIFYSALRKISENEKEPIKLRNIANYILEQIELKKQKLKAEMLDNCSRLFKGDLQ